MAGDSFGDRGRLEGGMLAWTGWAWSTPMALGVAATLASTASAQEESTIVVPGSPVGTGEAGQPLGATGAPGGGGAAPAAGPGLWIWLLPLGMLVLLIWTSSSQQKKERKRKEQLVSTLTKNDRVLMAGGMIGSIAEVKGDELLLKVDEQTGTKIRFSTGSVERVLKESPLRRVGGNATPGEDSDEAELEPAKQ